jgi:hypothetical protein
MLEELHGDVTGRVSLWCLIAWVLASAGLAAADSRAAIGFSSGGAVSLGIFSLHRSLVRWWWCKSDRRKARVWLWIIWVMKWPLVGTFLYCALKTGRVAPEWICVGAGLVPAMATIAAVQSLVAARRSPSAGAEAG